MPSVAARFKVSNAAHGPHQLCRQESQAAEVPNATATTATAFGAVADTAVTEVAEASQISQASVKWWPEVFGWSERGQDSKVKRHNATAVSQLHEQNKKLLDYQFHFLLMDTGSDKEILNDQSWSLFFDVLCLCANSAFPICWCPAQLGTNHWESLLSGPKMVCQE
eukprot:s370_g35.t1